MKRTDSPLPDRLRMSRARAQVVRGRRDWYRIDAAADEAAVYIYDEIGWFGVTADSFVRELRGVDAKRITLHLNTPGGDVFDGIAIMTALREHPASVEVRVDGLAASIGSVIAMAGDRIVMARHSTLMIHEPFTLGIGDSEDFRKLSEVLDQIGDTIAGVYSERAGGTVGEWRDRMRAETWYSDRAAVDAGLADEVAGDPATENRFDLSIFRHPPEDLLNRAGPPDPTPPTKRTIEKALRDAGLSSSQAKALIAAGWDHLEPENVTRDVSDLLALRDALTILTR